MAKHNPFLAFLEGQPQATFFSFQDQFGQSPGQRNVIRDQFSDIYNEYLGFLGQQARSGQQPSGTFEKFLDKPDFFKKRIQDLSPSQRGGGSRLNQFVPNLQFNFPR